MKCLTRSAARLLNTLVLLLAVGASLAAPERGQAAKPAEKTVRLVVDYGDGAELHLNGLTWKSGMTVVDLLAAAKAHRHGVGCVIQGKGPTALVTQIGDTKNQGSGGQSRNWLFSIGGRQSDEGAGVRTLAAGDVVLWKYDVLKYDD